MTDAASPSSSLAPPPVPAAAPRVASERSHHGDTVIDEYAWLAGKDSPETIAFLEAENAYTDGVLAGQAGLRETVFGEIRGRTKETDLSVPVRKGGWWYYSRTLEGRQYAVHCRRAVAPGETRPPLPADGQPLAGEQVLLDGNDLAGDSPFFALGAFSVSPDGGLLAFSTDFAGDERFTLRIRDLATGEVLADEIPGTFYGCAWSADGAALFYLTVDAAWRPFRVWRHRVGAPATTDTVVYEETDERFWVGVELTRSERYVCISAGSQTTSEVWLLDAADPAATPRVVAPRRPGVEYSVDHQLTADGGERLLVLHNDGAQDFELATAPLADPAAWTPLVPHQAGTRLESADAFAGHIVLRLRRDGLTGLRVLRGGGDFDVTFPEPVYTVSGGLNPEYGATSYRLSYTSLATPESVYDCDTATGELTLLRRQPVLPLPGGAEFDPAGYEQYREWAKAGDGTLVPVSIVCRRGVREAGPAPCVLYGYGSYEMSADPRFSIPRLSLLDRGFVFAIAHVRGGGELGRHWYEDGKLTRKMNTFTDFVACARHLVERGWTEPSRLIARGASAGGLLMGVVANIAAPAVGGIVAQVPFVDALTSVLDPSLPLTVTEWEEWGDPLHDPEAYAYLKSYSPYENVTDQAYPPILAITSLNDTRVLYREPAKWIAKLQAVATGGPFLLRTEMTAGHGGRSGRYDAWHEEALILAWVITTAGAGS